MYAHTSNDELENRDMACGLMQALQRVEALSLSISFIVPLVTVHNS